MFRLSHCDGPVVVVVALRLHASPRSLFALSQSKIQNEKTKTMAEPQEPPPNGPAAANHRNRRPIRRSQTVKLTILAILFCFILFLASFNASVRHLISVSEKEWVFFITIFITTYYMCVRLVLLWLCALTAMEGRASRVSRETCVLKWRDFSEERRGCLQWRRRR